MRPLSGLDATFIYLESDHSPMHIGGVYLSGCPAGLQLRIPAQPHHKPAAMLQGFS
jgi:hypothetical protein